MTTLHSVKTTDTDGVLPTVTLTLTWGGRPAHLTPHAYTLRPVTDYDAYLRSDYGQTVTLRPTCDRHGILTGERPLPTGYAIR